MDQPTVMVKKTDIHIHSTKDLYILYLQPCTLYRMYFHVTYVFVNRYCITHVAKLHAHVHVHVHVYYTVVMCCTCIVCTHLLCTHVHVHLIALLLIIIV